MAKNGKEEKIQNFIDKIAQSKKGKLDLSSDEDLSIGIMNLISIEEHFFFTANKTGKDKYYDMLREVRDIRKDLLKMIVQKYEGEVWCISKHLLAASMRLMEVGTKMLGQGRDKEAKDMFEKSFNLYSLFWGVNLNLVDTSNVAKIDDQAINRHDNEKKGLMGKLGNVVKKAIDCCLE
ncbi:hypothetical protein C4577_00790 [Candidatus Parcubacteria bacterium]|nr:MAG: hypothetical protein C4577_00790 [Candidatus Parcubacteria bacterium]